MLIEPLPHPPQMPRLFEVHEVAYLLKCSQETVRRLIRSGELRAIRVGAHLRIDQADLKAFLEAHRIQDLDRRRIARPDATTVAALQQTIATQEAVLDGELGIAPRGRDGPREVTRAS